LIDAALSSGIAAGDPAAVVVGPFAPLLERLFVASDAEGRSVYRTAFDDVRPSDGIRMFAEPSPPRSPGLWPLALAVAALAVALSVPRLAGMVPAAARTRRRVA
jgi:hypothetical protein